MDGARWDEVTALFGKALKVPPHERAAFLDQVCGSDTALRAQVEALLDAHEEAPGYFDDLAEAVIGPEWIAEEQAEASPAEASTIDPHQIIGQTVSHYQVHDKLGGGGMGVVYRAEDTQLGRTVALKFLPPYLSADDDAKMRFIQEAKAASALDHTNICTIYEIGETGAGQLFIAMAYYDGETLKKKIARGPLPLDKALDYAAQMTHGLAKAHARGIVHRDIKPANVMVTSDGVVKVVDFGLAKMTDVSLTQTGTTLGTVAYMSPEQARGVDVDHQTDVWSLGVVLYEMLTGERPFKGDYAQAIIYSVLHEDPPLLTELNEDVPPDLEHVVAMCLEKDKALRYPTVADLLADLDVLAQGSGSQTLLSGTLPATRSRPDRPAQSLPQQVAWPMLRRAMGRKHRVALIAAGVALLLLMGWFMRNRVPEARHLAVLPFNVIGDVADGRAFSDGLVEALTSKLTRLEQGQGSMWVVPASEVSAPMTPSDARDKLGVTMVVTGIVHVEGERVRLTLNLIDTRTRRQIDSDQFDHGTTSALALQDEAVLMLARMLQVKLEPEARTVLTAGGTTEPGANEFYLRGWGYLRNRQSVDDVEVAIGLFEMAVEADSLFALAYAGLGEAYWQKYQLTDDVQWVDDAVQHSQHALHLNAELAPIYVTLGIIYSGRQQYEEALRAYQQALEIDPFNAEAYRRRGAVYRRQGRFEEAETAYTQAISLMPGYWRGYSNLGVLYYYMGRYEDAIAQYNRGLQLAPSNRSLLINMGAAYWYLERLDEAIQTFERVLQIEPENASAKSNLATAYFYQGRFEDAARLYEEKLALRPHDYTVQGYLADAYYWIPGARDRAEQAYRKAITMAREHLTVSEQNLDVLGDLASSYARLGVRDTALVFLGQVESLLGPEQANVVTAFGIGEVYEQLGERERALVWMESAIKRGHGWIQVQYSPWLNDLRDDPGFLDMLAQYR